MDNLQRTGYQASTNSEYSLANQAWLVDKAHSALLIGLCTELQMQSQAPHPLHALAAFDNVGTPQLCYQQNMFSLTSWCLVFPHECGTSREARTLMISSAAVDSKASPASGTDEKLSKYHWSGSINERILLPRTSVSGVWKTSRSSLHHFILKLGKGEATWILRT